MAQITQDKLDRASRYRQFGSVASNLRAAVVDFLRGGDSNDDTGPDERITKDYVPLWEANAISSAIRSGLHPQATGKHKIAIDLDVPHAYVPSTTPGHGHLIIDVSLSWNQYRELLDHLAELGVLESGYVRAAAARRATWLRTPWTRKEPVTDENGWYETKVGDWS